MRRERGIILPQGDIYGRAAAGALTATAGMPMTYTVSTSAPASSYNAFNVMSTEWSK